MRSNPPKDWSPVNALVPATRIYCVWSSSESPAKFPWSVVAVVLNTVSKALSTAFVVPALFWNIIRPINIPPYVILSGILEGGVSSSA